MKYEIVPEYELDVMIWLLESKNVANETNGIKWTINMRTT